MAEVRKWFKFVWMKRIANEYSNIIAMLFSRICTHEASCLLHQKQSVCFKFSQVAVDLYVQYGQMQLSKRLGSFKQKH